MTSKKLTLIVVNNPRDWQFDIPGVTVVSAQDYLNQPSYGIAHQPQHVHQCKGARIRRLLRRAAVQLAQRRRRQANRQSSAQARHCSYSGVQAW